MHLVTGATGFIGKNLVPVLAAENRIRIFVRPTSDIAFYKNHPRIEIALGGLEQGQGLDRALEGVSTVVHVAGRTMGRSRSDFYRTNVLGTENLLAAMRRARTPNIVLISSYAACGSSPDRKGLSEEAPARPTCVYGWSKQKAESAVIKSGLRFIILRPPAVYGPYDEDVLQIIKMINRGFYPVLGAGEQYTDFIYVRDLVEVIKKVVNESIFNDRVYFVNDGRGHALSEVVRLIADILGKKRLLKVPIPKTIGLIFGVLSDVLILEKKRVISRDKFRLLTQKAWLGSSKRMIREIGFRPAYDLSKGMTETIDWYRRNGFIPLEKTTD
jgi:nucleoside-diphosphate-sugar epimerase